eukprot:364794-Chlamydomonas_euryale.AAC.20
MAAAAPDIALLCGWNDETAVDPASASMCAHTHTRMSSAPHSPNSAQYARTYRLPCYFRGVAWSTSPGAQTPDMALG